MRKSGGQAFQTEEQHVQRPWGRNGLSMFPPLQLRMQTHNLFLTHRMGGR